MSETNHQQTPFQIGLHYGALLSLIGVITSLLMLFFPDSFMKSTMFLLGNMVLSTGIFCGILSLAIKKYQKQQHGYSSFGQSFNVSAWAGLVYSFVMMLWMFFYYYLINPNYFKNVKQEAIMQLEAQGNVSDEIMSMQIALMDTMFSWYVMLPVTFVSSLIFTIILGVIMSAILKKEKENPFD